MTWFGDSDGRQILQTSKRQLENQQHTQLQLCYTYNYSQDGFLQVNSEVSDAQMFF